MLKDWEAAAKQLDVLEGNNEWKQDASTGDYNAELIESRLRELDEARASGDVVSMMYLIRTALSRDLGGMGNVDLYRHSYVGTKDLVDRYVDSAIQTIEALVDESAKSLPPSLTDSDLLECVVLARQSFGRSALLLSGGATFGMLHIGVLKALFEAKLLPRLISGTSAGSIVCAVMCTRTDAEIPELIRDFPYGDLDVFEDRDAPNGVLSHLHRLLTEGNWCDIGNLTRVMRGLLGDLTFQEAYNRTRRILNITVSTESMYELPRLLNYITAPNVMIWSAVAASCSVPLVFSAAPLLVKNPVTGEHLPWNPTPQRWIDGSVDNDLPMTKLAEMFNVNHFIVSQVNPHVVPFLAKDDHLRPQRKGVPKEPNKGCSSGPDWVSMMTALAKDEALHRLHFLAELGAFPTLWTKLWTMLSQQYSGDINILPEINVHDLPGLLTNPTSDFMLRSCLAGERATWPKLSRIRDRVAIELALDRAAHVLRARVVFSDSQVDLRRLAAGIMCLPWTKERPAQDGSKGSQGTGGRLSRATHRRGSGSSVQLLAHQRRMLLVDNITDDETEEEEWLEMLSRGGHVLPRLVMPRRPRLKRASKTQFDVLKTGPLTSPLEPLRDEESDFDFSRPIIPAHVAAVDDTRRETHGNTTQPSDPRLHAVSSAPRSGPTISPTEDTESTDPLPFSGGVDSQTDASVFGAEKKSSEKSKAGATAMSDTREVKTEEDVECQPRSEKEVTGAAGGGLWD